MRGYEDTLDPYFYEITDFVLYAETDKEITGLTIYTLLYACGAAFLITLIFIPYPFIALLVFMAVFQILAGVLGFMYFWDLAINVPTMVNIVITIGFSIDNVAHIAHSYMSAPLQGIPYDNKNKERFDRVLYALDAVGLPLLNGGLSTIAGLLVMLRV